MIDCHSGARQSLEPGIRKLLACHLGSRFRVRAFRAPRNDGKGRAMTKDIDELTLLNRDYVASVQNSDVKRFDEILAQDFYCTSRQNPGRPCRIPQADSDAGEDQE